MKWESCGVAELLKDYESYLITEKRASANTVSSYLRDVQQFAAALECKGVELTQALTQDVVEYTDALIRRGKSPATVTRSVASIKSFYTCLVSWGVVEQNPAKGVATAKVERKLPQVLTGQEVELFLEQPDCLEPKGCRDRAMLELLYATGIRVSELIALDVDDVNLPSGMLKCFGKGKERLIPLYPAAVRALKEYLRTVRPQLVDTAEETALFVNMNGERMSRQGFWKIIRRRRAFKRRLPHTRCATPSRPTCWRTGRTCGRSRRCWATRISPPHRSTPGSSARGSRMSIKRHTPGPDRIGSRRSSVHRQVHPAV